MRVQATPFDRSSRLAVEIYADVLDAVRADRLVATAVQREGSLLTIQGDTIDLSAFRRVRIAGLGKAAVEMAEALSDILGDFLTDGLVATKSGAGRPLPKIEVLEGSHPVPSDSSIVAGTRMFEFARTCNSDDLVLFVLSGGASAIAELPIDGVSLDDIQELNRHLLASGAEIGQINAIRVRLSRIKGGGLARAFGAATVAALVLSDVIGNSVASVGSGPLLPPSNIAISESVIDALPGRLRTEILSSDLLPAPVPVIPHHVIGSISVAIHAAVESAQSRGLAPLPFADRLVGEAREMSRRIMRLAAGAVRKNPDSPFCMIFGGETTVTLRGKGVGGRCQEMALAAAPALAKLPNVAMLAAGTDGGDGPTDAAGGLVDSGSLARASDHNVDHRRALVNNDSFSFLQASGGLLVTGPTGSNVNDICLVIYAPGPIEAIGDAHPRV